MIKILNLYAGIGGNRKLWAGNIQVTAVENNCEIAEIYKRNFPQDTVIVSDAHQYLLDHYKEFHFIWSSPPCPSHSGVNHFLNAQGVIRYPDVSLWQEIIFLKHFFKGKWAVENVKPYYDFIPAQKVGRHYIWSNFTIPINNIQSGGIGTLNRLATKAAQERAEKDNLNRNCVNPKIGLYVFNMAFRETQIKISEV